MNDFDHVVSTDLNFEDDPPKIKKGLVVALTVLAVFTISSFTFYFGIVKNKSDNISTASPTPQLSQVIGESIINEPNVVPTLANQALYVSPSSTPSAKPSPTPTVSLITPSPTPTPQMKTKTIFSSALLDGYWSSDATGDNKTAIKVGRNQSSITRGFVSFDISNIPEDATIDKVSLRVYQARTTGEDPYNSGVKIKIDHINYADSLDNNDYNLTTITANLSTLTSNSVVEWKDAIVTDAVKNDMAGNRTSSQFRLHFENEIQGGSVEGDYAIFESADNSEGTGNIPQLVVNYY